MLADVAWFIRRCTPAVVVNRVYDRWRRVRLWIIARMARLPLVGSLVSRYFLTKHIYLLDIEEKIQEGVSRIVREDKPAAEIFPQALFPAVYGEMSELLRNDPFGLAAYPAAPARQLAEGGHCLIDNPEPALVYVPPDRFHCTVRDAYLDMRTSGVCTRDGVMILDRSPLNQKNSSLQSQWRFGGRRPTNAQRREGLCMSLEGKWSSVNYFHWLVDGLLRIHRLIRVAGGRPVTLLVSRNLPSGWLTSLEMCLPDGFTVSCASGWVQMEQYLLLSPSRTASFAFPSKAESNRLRAAVFQGFGLDPNPSGTRRIFISRANALTRRLANEAEVEDVLARFGFQAVRLEELTFEQQVRLFHGASIVTGVHGAGFTNLLFSGPAQVLEYFPAGVFKPLFFGLCTSLGHSYHFLHGGRPSPLVDFRVDLSLLRDAIERMLESES